MLQGFGAKPANAAPQPSTHGCNVAAVLSERAVSSGRSPAPRLASHSRVCSSIADSLEGFALQIYALLDSPVNMVGSMMFTDADILQLRPEGAKDASRALLPTKSRPAAAKKVQAVPAAAVAAASPAAATMAAQPCVPNPNVEGCVWDLLKVFVVVYAASWMMSALIATLIGVRWQTGVCAQPGIVYGRKPVASCEANQHVYTFRRH